MLPLPACYNGTSKNPGIMRRFAWSAANVAASRTVMRFLLPKKARTACMSSQLRFLLPKKAQRRARLPEKARLACTVKSTALSPALKGAAAVDSHRVRAAVDENVHAAFLKRRGHARRWLRKECENDVTECVECCPPPRFCSAHSCWLGGSCFACPVRPSAFQALISPKQITPRCTEANPRLPVRPGRRRLRTTLPTGCGRQRRRRLRRRRSLSFPSPITHHPTAIFTSNT